MKKYISVIVSIMGILGMVSCGNGNGKSVPNEEKESNVTFDLQEIKGYKVYALEDGCYATFTYNVMWPKKAYGADTEKLQKFILQNILDTKSATIEEALEARGLEFAAQHGGKPVDNVTKEEVLKLREEKDEFEYSYPSLEFTFNAPEWDAERDIISFNYNTYIDLDNGLGAGTASYYKKIYYDYKNDKRIELSNLIDEAKIPTLLDMVKKKALAMPDDNCIIEESVNALDVLPDNFYFDDYILSFYFDKYEIACGEAGCIVVDIPFVNIIDLLSDYGKKLLLCGNSYSDEAVKTEAENRMNEYSSKYLKYGEIPKMPTINKEYFTEAYVEGMKQCEAKAEAEEMEAGWLDYDYWIDAQDYDGVEFKVVCVYVKNHDEAMVELAVKNFGEVRSKYVMWKREDGKLKIENLSTSGTTMRSMMKYYIGM